MSEKVPAEISVQLSQAVNVIGRHLESTLLAVYLYGSALDGGLKPYSDIDLLVAVAAPLNDAVQASLLVDNVPVSASPWPKQGTPRLGSDRCVVHSDIVPWRYPARRELHFGEVAAQDILAGMFEPATTILTWRPWRTKAKQHSIVGNRLSTRSDLRSATRCRKQSIGHCCR